MSTVESTAETAIEQSVAASLSGESPPMKVSRLESLDVFRGITIAGMLVVNNPGPGEPYAPLKHAVWHGWTSTDLIFPFFLFIVGVAIPFAFTKRKSDPTLSRGALLGHIWTRALALIMLGMLLRAMPGLWKPLPGGLRLLTVLHAISYVVVYGGILVLLTPWPWKRVANWSPPTLAVLFTLLMLAIFFANQHAITKGYNPAELGSGMFRPDTFRIPGVLQRIGICYGVAATIALFAGWRTILIAVVVLMAGYSGLMLKCPFPNHVTGSLTMTDNLARHIDERVFDRWTIDAQGNRAYTQRHTYRHYPDNEGLLTTIPAIATPLLGILVGIWLMSARPAMERCAALMAVGVPLSILGAWMDTWLMPINKILWTPSYVVFTAGLAMLGLGFLFWLIDVLHRRWWAWGFKVFGVNAIAAFALQSVVPHVMGMFTVDTSDSTRVSSLRYIQECAIAGLHTAADWIEVHAAFLPAIDTPGMTSLLGAVIFTVVVWLILVVLYFCRIYVKI